MAFETVRQWSSRLPVFPIKLVGSSHVTAELVTANNGTGSKGLEPLVGKSLRQAALFPYLKP